MEYNVNKSSRKHRLFPKTSFELKMMIYNEIANKGPGADLNHIDVFAIRDFSCMFYGYNFNGDISEWNVSNATNMREMFYGASAFNCDISGWDVHNVENMRYMFAHSAFNQDISKWDVSKVKDNHMMFDNCPCLEEYRPKFK